ncbi:hypothetical protein DSO57_1009123 [Entomophthora muscae]|uniref:Uncharacterized protein n=1 Tax=Entomophthora muscae TaxID=34485 RepID=A0ACC2TTV3_9FUNG|nr:hypothetical protein DSO57_1009123 [Entomophthora muscae]
MDRHPDSLLFISSVPFTPMPLQTNFEKSTRIEDEDKNLVIPRTSLKSINSTLVKTLKVHKELSLHLQNKEVDQDSSLSTEFLTTYLKLKDSFNASLKDLNDKNTQLFYKLSKQKRRKEWNKRKAERNAILLDKKKKQTLKLRCSN